MAMKLVVRMKQVVLPKYVALCSHCLLPEMVPYIHSVQIDRAIKEGKTLSKMKRVFSLLQLGSRRQWRYRPVARQPL
jgi:hypothetical protein